MVSSVKRSATTSMSAMSMESLGLMGEGCKQLFRIINNHANNTPSLGFADDYIHGLLTHRCAAALARGNHKALEAGRAHALQWSRQAVRGTTQRVDSSRISALRTEATSTAHILSQPM